MSRSTTSTDAHRPRRGGFTRGAWLLVPLVATFVLLVAGLASGTVAQSASPSDPIAGTWQTPPLTQAQIQGALVAAGLPADKITTFLADQGFTAPIVWSVQFDAGRYVLQGTFGGGVPQTLDHSTYRIARRPHAGRREWSWWTHLRLRSLWRCAHAPADLGGRRPEWQLDLLRDGHLRGRSVPTRGRHPGSLADPGQYGIDREPGTRGPLFGERLADVPRRRRPAQRGRRGSRGAAGAALALPGPGRGRRGHLGRG